MARSDRRRTTPRVAARARPSQGRRAREYDSHGQIRRQTLKTPVSARRAGADGDVERRDATSKAREMSFRSPRKTWRHDGHPRGLDAPAAATHPRMNGVCTYRKGLLGAVATTVIDGDADGRRELLGDARGLELLKGEATTETRLEVVALGRGVHDGAESTGGGPGVERLRLLLARDATGLLAARLVEPGLDLAGSGVALPVLLEVGVGDDVVVSHHLSCWSSSGRCRRDRKRDAAPRFPGFLLKRRKSARARGQRENHTRVFCCDFNLMSRGPRKIFPMSLYQVISSAARRRGHSHSRGA